MIKIFSYSLSGAAVEAIEGAFLGVKDGAIVFSSDDVSSPWMVSPLEAFLSAADRDAAIARGTKVLEALAPAPKAVKAAPKAPKAAKKAAPVAVKVTAKKAKKSA
jgi:hypothetical protein